MPEKLAPRLAAAAAPAAGAGFRLGDRAAALRPAARARLLDLAILGLLAGIVGVVHAWGMGRYPRFYDDEGIYVSQAWAVDKLHELAPYAYWYDHPPLGWILLAVWAKLVPTFGASLYSIAAARMFILAVLITSAGLLYFVARRLGLRRFFAAFAVLLFGLSPLAVHFQRMVLLDNIAVGWLLAAFALALTPARRLSAYAFAGVCFAGAVLTKETFLLFLPALALAIWQSARPEKRRFSLGVFVGLFVLIAGFYPLFAILRGEFVEGVNHRGLMQAVYWQLTRGGGGNILDPHSDIRVLVNDWLRLDPIVLGTAVLLIPLGLFLRRLRPVALGLAIPVAMVARGGYVPSMYVIGILPFAALTIAAVADWLWRPRAIIPASPAGTGWSRVASPSIGTAATLAAIALTGGVSTLAAPRWAQGDVEQMHTDAAAPTRAAVDWLSMHAGRTDRVLVDDTVWTDLVERGFNHKRIIVFWRFDRDPAVRLRSNQFDYFVRSNANLAGNLYWVPKTRQVLEHSRTVAIFQNHHERIEIRRVMDSRKNSTPGT